MLNALASMRLKVCIKLLPCLEQFSASVTEVRSRIASIFGLKRILTLVAAVFSIVLMASPASAAVTFTLNTGNSSTNTQKLIIDSNGCSTAGPKAAYVGGTITNTGPTAVTGITATMTGLTANIYLTGGQPASQFLGTLGVGESVGVYWYVGYNCALNATATPSISITSSLGPQSSSTNLEIKEAISANAGGQVTVAALGAGAVVGQLIPLDVTYSFGGASAGDEYFLQPAGNQSFNAACFRLVSAQITSSIVTAIPSGTANKLYFLASTSQSGTNKTVSVRYTFQYLCANTTTTASAYSAQTSGATNIKYTGNYGATQISFPGGSNPFTITKTVSPTTSFVGGGVTTLTYTVTVSNPSAYATIVDRIDDQLPAGISYIGIGSGSGVTTSNSGVLPASGATGTISFQGKAGVSYTLAAGGSLTLVYTANAPTTAGTYVNTAQAFIGTASTPTASATFTLAPPVNAITESGSVTAGVTSTAIANVRSNDTINGALATAANSTIAVSGTWTAGITLDTATGAVNVASTVAPGTYSVTYQLCNLATPTPSCTTVADTITVVAASVDLVVVKSNGVSTVAPGSTTTYTVTVTNNGPDPVTGAVVTDVVGTGLSCPAGNAVTITGSGVPAGSFTISNLTGSGIALATLNNGQSAILSYSCQVN